ncbi:hypothetical protein RHGRI_021802 [Rhododendron griersonianum]|uniref:Uncharacterized protein n=1 Tax=Rhododendron griersonianum TaxID=479676 RepID=A0AAV6JRJ0_9ERIC|nr:hypothetical protein RHGRI_021802 [Rhododendron griersonianum]
MRVGSAMSSMKLLEASLGPVSREASLRLGSAMSPMKLPPRMINSELVTWTSVIEGYGACGLGFEALQIPLLAGLLSEGCRVFYAMKWRFGMEPDRTESLHLYRGFVEPVWEAQRGFRWDRVEEVQRGMNDIDLMKKPEWSSIEAKGSIHGLISGS